MIRTGRDPFLSSRGASQPQPAWRGQRSKVLGPPQLVLCREGGILERLDIAAEPASATEGRGRPALRVRVCRCRTVGRYPLPASGSSSQ